MTYTATKLRARHLQDKLEVPYTKALAYAEGIESAFTSQFGLHPYNSPIGPVHEEDLLVTHLLGSGWMFFAYDMERPYRGFYTTLSPFYTDTNYRLSVDLDYTTSFQNSSKFKVTIEPYVDSAESVESAIDDFELKPTTSVHEMVQQLKELRDHVARAMAPETHWQWLADWGTAPEAGEYSE